MNPHPPERYTADRLCRVLGKPFPYVRNAQAALALPAPKDGKGYSAAYLRLLEKVIALRTLSVPMEDIAELLQKEKRLLEILHADTLSDSPTWYLDHCGQKGDPGRRLLLTDYDLGFTLGANAVQTHLNFGRKTQELFTGKEMGEDVHRAMDGYLQLRNRIRDRVRQEEPVLRNALRWALEEFGAPQPPAGPP